VLARLMMTIVARWREPIQPLDQVLLQPGLLVVHPDAGCDVHRGDEAEPLGDVRRRDDLGDSLGDVDELAPRAGVEPEIVGMGPHHATTASASISMSAWSSMSRLTSTSDVAGRMLAKNSPCTLMASVACAMSMMNMRVLTTCSSVPPSA